MSLYQRANAQLGVGSIVPLVPIPPSAERLLDLGGSHGLFSIGFCKQHPNLDAVVFDFPVALVETEKAVAAEGLAGRVTVQHGDYLEDDIGHGYDVILCFFLPHNHTEDDNKRLMAKASRALKPGGMIVVHEMLRDDPPSSFNAMYSLLFFLYSGTRNYGYQEITGWLTEVGFGEFKRMDVPPGGMTSIVTAIKE